jgi:ribosomal protein L37AE/L43A
MPFLNCPECEATVYFRAASVLGSRTCTRCGTGLSKPARQLSTAELRMRRKAKLPPWLLESSDKRIQTG